MSSSPVSASSSTTTPYHHGDLRRALLEAARSLVEAEGLEALGLRRIAREVGVSHAAPYRHFADHSELLAALAGVGFEELAERFAGAVAAGGPDGALERGGLAYIGFGLENPALFRLMFDAQDTAVAERLEPAARAAYEVFASSLRAGPGATREELAATAWSVVHGYTLLMVNGHLPDPVEPRVVVERAMSGLASMTGARGARG